MQSESCHRGGERRVQTTEEYFAKSRVCVCVSAWCVSDLLVVRVCMCVCALSTACCSMIFFFPFSGESVTLWLYQKGLGI